MEKKKPGMRNKKTRSIIVMIIHHQFFHHDVGGVSLPRRTTNDLAGGASGAEANPSPEPLPLPDPLGNGCEDLRSRRTTNERPVSAGFPINASSPGLASSPLLCHRGFR